MKITVIGGGPGGLYFAILMKKADPGHDITVYERNSPDDTFGWGVVFSEATLENILESDEESFSEIADTFATWDEVHVHFKGEVVRSGGHDFCGIGRRRLLNILQARAERLGVGLRYRTEVTDLDGFRDSDLIVAADGVNSRIRDMYADAFRPTIEPGRAKYIWLGTTRPFDAFTFFCKENEHGFFTVHAYQFDEKTSTFIVETDEESWRNAGLDGWDIDHTVAYLEELFREELDGHRLRTNKSEWINFRRVKNEHWYTGNVVLLGDAVRTAHFSVGSGSKLAMEDAIALDLYLRECATIEEALSLYEEERKWFSDKLQQMAQESRRWFETIKQRRHLEPRQFAYAMLTRNKRLGHDQLRERDEAYVAGVDRWFAERAGVGDRDPAPPPMFTPFELRGLRLENRVVVSPMCMYSAEDGEVNDWHLVHLGARAAGGAGLVIAEMTDVSRDGRITPGCAGMYKTEHVAGWRRVVDFVHRWTAGKIGLQIGHAGQKGATRLLWEGYDEPLASGAWPLLSASARPYHSYSQVPKQMGRAEMDEVTADFVRAAELADQAGFDLLEVHMAHGYLLASFLSPLTNLRGDEYGGPIEQRMRFPLEVFAAVRAVWPEEKPMSVRLSAIDWKEGGQAIEDSIAVGRALKAAGCDLIDVSSGHTADDEDPELGRCYQVPFAERIRHEVGIPTVAVGAITRHGEINAILASGCADLCALARPHLFDPHFTLRAAAEQQYPGARWPVQYETAEPEPREKLRWFERARKRRRSVR
ncbi:MAG: bifunctional salicylyl-CoA 5-hydroxylase/oxidoreductase [Planctomycetota bacterium]